MRNRIAGLVIAALTATSAALVLVHPASATGGCAAEMPVRAQYPSMLSGELTVVSLGRSLPEWTLDFQLRYPSEQIKNVDGVRWEQHGDHVTLHGLPGAGLPADRPISFRYVMTHGVKRGDPPVFTLNGVPCGTVLPPSPSPSSSVPPSPTSPPSPTPSSSPSPTPDPNRPVVRITRPEDGDHFFAPATITVEATATPAPGRRITRVEFFHTGDSPDSAPFETDTTAPYTAEWRDVPAGGYSFFAVAYDDQGAKQSGKNAPFVRVLTPGEERQAPYVTVVRDRLWGISPVIDAVAPRELAPLARSGAESRCVQGRGIWDGPVDARAVAGLAARGFRAVYLALNEACWLGLPYVDPRYGGEPYRQEVVAYTQRLAVAGITPIVGLTWSEGRYTGPGATCRDERAVCAKPMPDAAHAIDFWQSVGQTLGTEAVVYDLFTAPYPDRAIGDPAQAWTCWRDGAEACSALGYPAVGMWALYLAVRTGSFGVLLAGGLRGGSDLSRWAAYVPEDWYYNIAAAWRPATPGDCRPPVLAQAPVVVTTTCR
ncbi:Ig-like domain-containing protein [Micromonospora sp. NPDC049836]|uniref:Ig-like domain-containing protein n=1 Tax=Micromonospora sp. NPDC049836 TaxID=3364274 RepID=UPI00378AC610